MVIAPALLGLLVGASPSAISVSDIVGVTELSGLSVSPDGDWLAFRTEQADAKRNTYFLQWWIAPANRRAAPQRIVDGGDALFTDAGMVKSEQPVWSPDSRHFMFRALHQGEVQIWQAAVGRRGARQLTHDRSNVLDFKLSADGRSLSFHVAATRSAIEQAEQKAHDDGVLVDASVDIAQPISRGAWLDGKPASERLTGHWFAHGNLLWRAPDRTVTLKLPASPKPVSPIPMSSGPDTSTIRVVDGNLALFAEGPSGKEERCGTAPCEAGRPMTAALIRDHRTWLVTTADLAQDQTLSLWRPGQTDGRILRAEPGQLSGDREKDTPCAIGDAAIFCVEADAVSPPQLVSIDLASGRLGIVFDPNAALRRRISNPVRTVEWTSTDHFPFSAKLILPTTAKPKAGYPLVMNYYDCPGFLRGGLGDELPMLPLAGKGIAVLCINMPRSTSDDRNAAIDYDHAIAGVTAIIDQLDHEQSIDRNRLGMWGLSFGSEIVMAVAQRTRLLSAASVSTGIVEPGFYWFNDVAGRDTPDILSKAFGVGDPEVDRAGWKALSPALNADAIKTPLLMQLPEQEARWSMQLYSRLSRSVTPVEMYAFANERHIKQQPRHRDAAYTRNLDWFRYWLQGERDPDPGKDSQYAKWDALSVRWKRGIIVADQSQP